MILWWYSWSEKFKTASPSRGLKGWSFVCLGSGSPERAPRPLSAEKGEGMDDKIFKSLLQNFSECLQPDNVNSWTSQKRAGASTKPKERKKDWKFSGSETEVVGKLRGVPRPQGPSQSQPACKDDPVNISTVRQGKVGIRGRDTFSHRLVGFLHSSSLGLQRTLTLQKTSAKRVSNFLKEQKYSKQIQLFPKHSECQWLSWFKFCDHYTLYPRW